MNRSAATVSSQSSVASSLILQATGSQLGGADAWPAIPFPRAVSASKFAALIIIFDGMQPKYGHSPPISRDSMPATARPASARQPATSSPPGPIPMTTTSNSCSLTLASPDCQIHLLWNRTSTSGNYHGRPPVAQVVPGADRGSALEMEIALPADTTDAASAHNQTARSRSGGAEESCMEAGDPLADACSPISETEAERLIRAICFKTGPPGTIGAELEWLVRDTTDPAENVPFDRISKVFDSLQKPGILPGAGLLTLEPGGQVELSTAPAKDLSDCVAAASDALPVLHEPFPDPALALPPPPTHPLPRPTPVLA